VNFLKAENFACVDEKDFLYSFPIGCDGVMGKESFWVEN
jgi:hypothetical protein